MRPDEILQAHRLSTAALRVAAGPPANDNLTFPERVRAEIAAAARAVGESYSERELGGFAAEAREIVRALRRDLPSPIS